MVSFSSVVLSGLRDRSSYFAGRSHVWLERKKNQSLAQGDWLFIPTSLLCLAGQGCRRTTQPVVSPYKVTDKILSCGRLAGATNSAVGPLFRSRSRLNSPAARKISQ